MNGTLDLEVIRQKLEQQRQVLLKYVEDEERGLQLPVGANPDQLDLAQAYRSKERRSALLARSRLQLKQVEAALRRLDEGTYGKCVQCGAPITPSRLKVLPYAPSCIECQERQEAH
jgi:RNA polymerase-binding transcription factor